MQTLTAKQIAAEIRQHFPHFATERFAKDQEIFGAARTGAKGDSGDTRVGSNVLHDFCQIGALLTDDGVCRRHLTTLDQQLRSELGIQSRNVPSLTPLQPNTAAPGMKLPSNKGVSRDQYIEAVVDEFVRWRETAEGKRYAMKFNGVLQLVLQRQEDRFGFNGAEPEDESAVVPLPSSAVLKKPGQTPVLTGFVIPADFNKYLLEQKRHWKDPGARLTHGEFTHRLQWWIVMQEKIAGDKAKYPIRGDVSKRFAQLVKYPYHPTGVTGPADAKGRTMWDFLFDCFTNAAPKSADSYRTPDNLHTDVMNGVGGSTLKAIIVARNNKRVIMNNSIGGKALDDFEAWKCHNKRYAPMQDESQVIKFIVTKVTS
jgi:hypothetical protein